MTRQSLLDRLRQLAQHYGRTPSEPLINRHSPPSHMAFVRTFGSLRKAQAAAGLLPNVQRGKPW